MGLIDALLLEPVRIDHWIAKRADGSKGTGTAADPWGATTAAEFDDIMTNKIPEFACVHLGPGTFDTNGYAEGLSGGWQAKKGLRLVGSGMDVTYLKVVRTGATTQVAHLLNLNGIDLRRVTILPIQSAQELAEVYRATYLGLFSNRCEGGTNLVMMEYMACGKPVIASFTSGHTDVLNESNAVCLKRLDDLQLLGSDLQVVGRWQQPRIDDIVHAVEELYHDRNRISRLGNQAGEDSRRWTWGRAAQTLLQTMDLPMINNCGQRLERW